MEAATRAIAHQLAPGNLVILEVTSPVGTTEQVARRLAEERPELAIASRTHHPAEPVETIRVTHCPKRVLPGYIIHELFENDCIVGGVDMASDMASSATAADFYREFVTGPARSLPPTAVPPS